MIINELNTKVVGKFVKEITIDDDGDSTVYVYPDTKEFLKVINRRSYKWDLFGLFSDEK